MKKCIQAYYDELAEQYDVNRFSNTYGRYIHLQEDRIVSKLLKDTDKNKNLDIACGTGRFLNYSNWGIDISCNMILEAKRKYPQKNLFVEDAIGTSFSNEQFQNVTGFHLLMHLDNEKLIQLLDEMYRITKKDGVFIFDMPSLKRRKLMGYKKTSWHGSNSISHDQLIKIISPKWHLIQYSGIAFFPIHRIPKALRKYFINLDNVMSSSILKEYSSHLIFVLKKK